MSKTESDLDIRDTIDLIVTKLNELIPVSETGEEILLASKSVDVMANQEYLPLPEKDITVKDDVVIDENVTDKIVDAIEAAYDQIDSLIPGITKSEDLLYLTKAIMSINGGVNGWLMIYQPNNSDEILAKLKARNDISLNLITDIFTKIINASNTGEEILFAGKSLETVMNISANSDTSGSVLVILESMQKQIEQVKYDMAAMESRLNGRMDLIVSDFNKKLGDINSDITSLTARVDALETNGDSLDLKLEEHMDDNSNPHSVTKDQITLSNVSNYSNTSDLNNDSNETYALAKSTYDLNEKAKRNSSDINMLSDRVVALEIDADNYYRKSGGEINGDVNITGGLEVDNDIGGLGG